MPLSGLSCKPQVSLAGELRDMTVPLTGQAFSSALAQLEPRDQNSQLYYRVHVSPNYTCLGGHGFIVSQREQDGRPVAQTQDRVSGFKSQPLYLRVVRPLQVIFPLPTAGVIFLKWGHTCPVLEQALPHARIVLMAFIYLHMCACVHSTAQLLGAASLLLASWSWDSNLGPQGLATKSYSLSRLLGSSLSVFYLHYVMNMFSVKTRMEKILSSTWADYL